MIPTKILNFAFIISCVILSGCRRETDTPKAQYDKCQEMLKTGREELASQNLDEAMDISVKALDIAEEYGYAELKAEVLCAMAHIDVAASHDDLAWEYSTQAEEIARKGGFDRMLARALNLKARICMLADTAPDSNRNDEALGYLEESMKLCNAADYVSDRIDALICFSQVYVNKNRWNTNLNQTYYRKAGEALDEAEQLSRDSGNDLQQIKFLAYRMRYYRQGGRTDDAIAYCRDIISESAEDDHLIRMQIYDNMANLLAQKNLTDSVVTYHSLCASETTKYYLKTSNDKLLDIQTHYETSLKETKIQRMKSQLAALVLLIALCALIILWLYGYNRRTKKRNIELQKANHIKEDLLSFLSKDLSNPISAQRNAVTELAEKCISLSEDDVKLRCKDLAASTESLNEEVADYMTGVIMARKSAATNMGLTKRELEVLKLSADGLTIKEIASKLNLSDRTVGNHRTHIFEKMDVSNISEMIKKASEYGII